MFRCLARGSSDFPGNAKAGKVFKVLERQSPVLLLGLLSLQSILGPDTLAIDELAFPRLDVPIKIGNQLVLLVGHACSKVRDAGIGLL